MNDQSHRTLLSQEIIARCLAGLLTICNRGTSILADLSDKESWEITLLIRQRGINPLAWLSLTGMTLCFQPALFSQRQKTKWNISKTFFSATFGLFSISRHFMIGSIHQSIMVFYVCRSAPGRRAHQDQTGFLFQFVWSGRLICLIIKALQMLQIIKCK